ESNEVKELSPYKPADDHCNHEVIVFYKRVINLLLSNIRIQDENEELIKGLIEIQVSHSQMEILKNFHTQKTSLREIDEILSNIIQQPHYDYMFGVMYMCDILHKIFQTVLKTIQEHPDGAIIMFTMLMVCLMFKMLRRGQKLPIFYIIQIILILSFFMTWWQLMKEAEIKSIAAQMKFSEIPISCQPHKMSLWQKFVSSFSNDDCEKYYETIMSNPKLKITPAFALSHFITTVILHPISHMGTVISNFISNATDNLPWTYGWIIKCMLFLSVGFVIIMVPFFLSGASFNLGLGPLLNFGINNHERKNEKGNSLRSLENREPVQVILQVAHGTNVREIQDMPKVKQSITPPVLKDYCEEEAIAIDNIQESCDDLSCGDTIRTNKLTNDNDEKLNKSEKLDATTIENKDGRGDG
ncbi:Chloride channel CLIC-like protein 1, partial [Melipona quadrifasciata]